MGMVLCLFLAQFDDDGDVHSNRHRRWPLGWRAPNRQCVAVVLTGDGVGGGRRRRERELTVCVCVCVEAAAGWWPWEVVCVCGRVSATAIHAGGCNRNGGGVWGWGGGGFFDGPGERSSSSGAGPTRSGRRRCCAGLNAVAGVRRVAQVVAGRRGQRGSRWVRRRKCSPPAAGSPRWYRSDAVARRRCRTATGRRRGCLLRFGVAEPRVARIAAQSGNGARRGLPAGARSSRRRTPARRRGYRCRRADTGELWLPSSDRGSRGHCDLLVVSRSASHANSAR